VLWASKLLAKIQSESPEQTPVLFKSQADCGSVCLRAEKRWQKLFFRIIPYPCVFEGRPELTPDCGESDVGTAIEE
jgi:hypothetical protein